VADARRGIEGRLLRAALLRRPGMVSLAVLAVAIATSVAAALLHISDDVSRKVGRELRSLGPNLLIVPPSIAPGPVHGGLAAEPRQFLEETLVRDALGRANLDGVLLLHARVTVGESTVPVVGAEIESAIALHPSWTIGPGTRESLMGVGLMRRLGVAPGNVLELRSGDRSVTATVGAALETGGPDDEAWWLPLATVQALAGQPGRVSLAQARVEGGPDAAAAAVAAIAGDGIEAVLLHALSATEAGLLERMQRLMLFVSLAALAAGTLAAFGTLTDLALVRRREIALMKSLGARRRDILRQFTVESLAIGGAGGIVGWLIGAFFAELIGRQVFHAAIALRPGVPLVVMALALAVAVLAGLGPVRLALAVEPAAALKGE
jgi:putative ABC transport system permease protein